MKKPKEPSVRIIQEGVNPNKPRARLYEYVHAFSGKTYWIVAYRTWFGWKKEKDMYGFVVKFSDKKEALQTFNYYAGSRKDKLISMQEK